MQRPAPSAYRDADREWWWIFDPRQSLRARAALYAGLGAALFAALVTWLAGRTCQRTLEAQLHAGFESLAFQLGDKLDRAVYERYRTLQLGASLTPVRDPATPLVERRRAVAALHESSPDFAWVGLTDVRGRIIASTDAAVEGTSAELRPWFRGARENGYAGPLREIPELARSAVAAPENDAATRAFDLAVPVLDPDGQFTGVLAAQVRWSWARDAQLSVVPESLTRDRIGATVYLGADVLLDSGASGWSHPPDPPVLGENRRGRGTMIERTSLGTTYLTGFARSRGFREYRGLNWLTVVRQPLDLAFAPVAQLRRTVAAWGCVLAIVAAAVAWALATRHARRLRSIRAAADRIHEGDILAVLPRPPGPSEMSRMCAALGDLVEDLRKKQPPPNEPPP